MKTKHLVIVESPAKARTLSKFLGGEYIIKSSFGHVQDLPSNKLGFDPENDFKPEYRVTPDKVKTVRALKSYIDKDTTIYLASDDDREGEMISYTLINALGIEKHLKKRIVFHEITKKAVLYAIKNPVELNIPLAMAAMARRILDRAVGYKLSPLLWAKIQYKLSAGRVQSVAVMIVVDREKHINGFIPDEFWKIKLDIMHEVRFKAELSKINGKKLIIKNKSEAYVIKNDCYNKKYLLKNITEKSYNRTPPPPLITSTLQQIASSKAGLSVKSTMIIAQKLYEGSINIPGYTGGLITYMRTDSTNLSKLATDSCKKLITETYGSKYALDTPRVYKGKSKGAQEAHEAIRPVDISITPFDIKSYVDDSTYKLYTLIWNRTVASQMKEAVVSNTIYEIVGGTDGKYLFIAKGVKILFDGYMKVYNIGNDDTSKKRDNDEKFLPNAPKGQKFKNVILTPEQNYTKPLPRYNEATLIKKLESEGVGRPSTYNSIISTLFNRDYVIKDKDKKLQPTKIGMVVSDYLVESFPNIVNLKFTAKIENEFDKIAQGSVKWQTIMKDFYFDFVKQVDDKYGGDSISYSDKRVLGKKDNLEVAVQTSKYGVYITHGVTDKIKKIKAKTSPTPKGTICENVTLEDAHKYLTLPKILGKVDDVDLKLSIGLYGPYIQLDKKYYSVKKEYDIYTLTYKEAVDIITDENKRIEENTWWVNKKSTMFILNGRFGPYIKHNKKNVKLSKKYTKEIVSKMTEKEILQIIKGGK